MISIIVYGRNDAHGYNLHRRVALSLNCLAGVLTDATDEILFVDYGTSDELPTLVEALADTLTERCLEVLRVLRVPAALHRERYGARTHLPVVEPASRNAAARRANPENRWLLSTNTDMILVPLVDRSLSEICGELPDGFYGLPRFELPEWLWERLPRSDPVAAIAEIDRLGPSLRLDEPTLSHDSIRFDAPGDFQLILREDFFAIDGFDEEMLLGWHVDSNLSKRMLLHRSAIQSLEEHLAGYHCNHNRTPTTYHSTEVANDLGRFFVSVDQVELPAQRETWGFVGVALEEVRVRERVGPHFAATVLAATANRPSFRESSDARETKFALHYDSSHVVPFIADSLMVSRPDATVAYVGSNPVLEEMLAMLVAGLDLGGPLVVAKLEDLRSVSDLDRIADILVIDLGIDASLHDVSLSTASGHKFAQSRARLLQTFAVFQRLVELERDRLELGEHPRRFVLVNSSAVFWNAYVLAHMHCSPTTPHARVRNAIAKKLPDDSEVTRAAETRALRLFRWISRRDSGRGRLQVRSGATIEIADLDDYAGFGRGWAFPDKTAVWTRGPRSELAIAVEETFEGSCPLTLSFDEIGVRNGDSLTIDLLADGERIASGVFPRHASRSPGTGLRTTARALGLTRVGIVRWLYFGGLGVRARARALIRRTPGQAGDPRLTWHVMLPSRVLDGGTIDLTLVVQEPVSWSDDQRLGLRLRSIAVRRTGRPRNRGEALRKKIPVAS